uniref:Transmembrane protein 176A n=1 Tax=Bos indicus x Bos taurus TaxID=30522 RepID=A0A4W2FRX1_BOBOX
MILITSARTINLKSSHLYCMSFSEQLHASPTWPPVKDTSQVSSDSADAQGGSDLFTDPPQEAQSEFQPDHPWTPGISIILRPRMCLRLQLPPSLLAAGKPWRGPVLQLGSCLILPCWHSTKYLPLLPARVSPALPTTLHCRSLRRAGKVMQIVLGLLSGVLGGFLYIFSSTTLRNSGAPIWTGAVATSKPRAAMATATGQPSQAVLAGAVAFIYEKRGGIYWALLRTLLALAAFSTATAATIIGAGRFYEYHFIFYKGICNVSPSWRPTGAPTLSPDLERLQQCTAYVNMLKALFISINAMLLGVWVLLLLASLLPLCLCCWRRYRRKEKRDLPLEETVRSE